MENNNNNKENLTNDNSNKENLTENLISLLSFLIIFAVGFFLVGPFVKNLYKDFRNLNKDEWISVYNSEDRSIYYNPSKIIHTRNGNVRMWLRFTGKSVKNWAIKEGVENGISAEKYNNWAFDEELDEFDCKNQTYREVYYLSYDADGKVIYEENNATDSFSPVVPDTIEEDIYKLACKNQSFLCRLLPFICKIIKNN